MAGAQLLASIIIPTYNYANFICDAIDSVLNSDFPQNQLEIIIIDDGSIDGTAQRIGIYKNRIKYILQRKAGKAQATKVGIEYAQGRYCFNLDADDLFLSRKIQQVVNVFEQDRDLVHVAHAAICWEMASNNRQIESIPNVLKGQKVNGKELLSYFYRRKMLFGGGSTFAARTDVLKHIPISKNVDMLIDEYLILFTLKSGYSYFIEEPLSIWRIHDKNFSNPTMGISKDNDKMQRNVTSMKLIEDVLQNNDFPEDVKKLYSLKVKVSIIKAREQLGKKLLSDVFDMWTFFIKNSYLYKRDLFKIIKSYTLLNRTLPVIILNLLRKIKYSFSQIG